MSEILNANDNGFVVVSIQYRVSFSAIASRSYRARLTTSSSVLLDTSLLLMLNLEAWLTQDC